MIKINFSLMDLIIPAKDINVLTLHIFFCTLLEMLVFCTPLQYTEMHQI